MSEEEFLEHQLRQSDIVIEKLINERENLQQALKERDEIIETLRQACQLCSTKTEDNGFGEQAWTREATACRIALSHLAELKKRWAEK